MTSNVKGVIFDLDGVVVSTDSLHSQAWREMCSIYGLVYDMQCEQATKGVSRMQSLINILKINQYSGFDDKKMLSLCEHKNKIFYNLLKNINESFIIDSVPEIIELLKCAGILIGIASSSKNAKKILESVGLLACFDAIVTGNEIENSKPNPEVFIRCMEILRLTGSYCIAIEDSFTGLQAAKQAEMITIYVGTNKTCADFADYHITEMRLLKDIKLFSFIN